jgi:hypothetical protein
MPQLLFLTFIFVVNRFPGLSSSIYRKDHMTSRSSLEKLVVDKMDVDLEVDTDNQDAAVSVGASSPKLEVVHDEVKFMHIVLYRVY